MIILYFLPKTELNFRVRKNFTMKSLCPSINQLCGRGTKTKTSCHKLESQPGRPSPNHLIKKKKGKEKKRKKNVAVLQFPSSVGQKCPHSPGLLMLNMVIKFQ